jgi:cobalt-zinc-cadmium efflux system protein
MSVDTHSERHLPVGAGSDVRGRLAAALWLTLAFVLVEAAAGFLGNSLALLTDAAHNLTDVAALALSWFALRLQARPANQRRTYGYHRVGILVAMLNSGGLLLISVWILFEAYRRFLHPSNVDAGILTVMGLAAFVVNLVTALLIRRGSETDLNLRSAFLHLMGDVASTAAAVAAGIGIYITKANWLDPLASAIIAVLILFGGFGVLREAVSILLESAPRDVNMEALVTDVLTVPGVLGIHDLHVWSLSRSARTMSAHILTEEIGRDVGERIRRDIGAVLSTRYSIQHATLQLECPACDSEDLYCEIETPTGPNAV